MSSDKNSILQLLKSLEESKTLEEKEKKKKSKKLSLKNIEKKILSDFDILDIPDEGKMTLKQHQKKVIDILRKRRGLLVVHETGSGKTLTAVVASQYYLKTYPNKFVIVITPVSLQNNFKKELTAYGIEDQSKYKFYTYQGFQNAYEANLVDCNNTMLIVDEAHNLKAISGSHATAVISCAKRADRVLLLTATPVINRAEDIKNLLTMIDGYRTRDVLFDEAGNDIADEEKIKRNFLCKTSFYEPSIQETSVYYPRKIIHPPVFIPMTLPYYLNYRAVENNIRANKTIIELFGSKANLKTFFNGIRRASNNLDKENSPKINWIIEKILSSDPSDKFVIFSHFLEAGIFLVMKRLKELDISFGHIDGQMKMDERKRIIDSYNQNKIKVLLISMAGGEGLDLKETRYLIVMEPDWNENNINQVIGRAVRFGSHSSLPSYKRRVDIYKLYMIKPKEFENQRYKIIMQNPETTRWGSEALSVDLYLLNYSSMKQHVIDDYIERIKKYSIENQNC
jgi:SNF2 family DNA or RNA helicase